MSDKHDVILRTHVKAGKRVAIPWDQIGAEYMGGTISVVALAKKYRVSETGIRSKIKRHGWREKKVELSRKALERVAKNTFRGIARAAEENVEVVLHEMAIDVEQFRSMEKVLLQQYFELDGNGVPVGIRRVEKTWMVNGSICRDQVEPGHLEIRAVLQAIQTANTIKYLSMGYPRDAVRLAAYGQKKHAAEILRDVRVFDDIPEAMIRLIELHPSLAESSKPYAEAMYRKEMVRHTKENGLSHRQFGRLLEQLGGILTSVFAGDPDALEEFSRRWAVVLEEVILDV